MTNFDPTLSEVSEDLELSPVKVPPLAKPVAVEKPKEKLDVKLLSQE